MINETDPAHPVGAYGQQTTTGETILMKYSAMFMAAMIGNSNYVQDDEDLSISAIYKAKTLIAEINKRVK